MSSDPMNTDWLDVSSLKSVAARRFAEFCQQDFAEQQTGADFDAELYREASRYIVERIEQSIVGGVK